MNEIVPLIIGYVGGTCSILSFLAQLWSVYKQKSAESLSYIFILFQFFVNTIYMIYGVLIKSAPLFVCNGAVCILLIVLVIMKWFYSRDKRDSSVNLELKQMIVDHMLDTDDMLDADDMNNEVII